MLISHLLCLEFIKTEIRSQDVQTLSRISHLTGRVVSHSWKVATRVATSRLKVQFTSWLGGQREATGRGSDGGSTLLVRSEWPATPLVSSEWLATRLLPPAWVFLSPPPGEGVVVAPPPPPSSPSPGSAPCSTLPRRGLASCSSTFQTKTTCLDKVKWWRFKCWGFVLSFSASGFTKRMPKKFLN